MSAISAMPDRLRRLLAALAVGAVVVVPAAGCNDDSADSDNGEETSEVDETEGDTAEDDTTEDSDDSEED